MDGCGNNNNISSSSNSKTTVCFCLFIYYFSLLKINNKKTYSKHQTIASAAAADQVHRSSGCALSIASLIFLVSKWSCGVSSTWSSRARPEMARRPLLRARLLLCIVFVISQHPRAVWWSLLFVPRPIKTELSCSPMHNSLVYCSYPILFFSFHFLYFFFFLYFSFKSGSQFLLFGPL